jgi:ribosomal protein L12E/L44/L45/RPP1/RPP2
MNDDDDVLLQDGDGNEVTISNIDEAINDIDEACDNLDNEPYNDMPSDKETTEEKAARKKREEEAKEKEKKNKNEGEDNDNIVFYAEATQFELIS